MLGEPGGENFEQWRGITAAACDNGEVLGLDEALGESFVAALFWAECGFRDGRQGHHHIPFLYAEAKGPVHDP